ncbi:hypothetical protein YSA_09602 [Pseudomonas putida ND6]|uniref:Uncharacterized protein n=1 Tax=Pseudomonas putida ND6 TaxID=231023 RepID=I3V2K5_PSEPU|nr:hypothetical protein YSA_09602 [Pseudomonas putida ND6]
MALVNSGDSDQLNKCLSLARAYKLLAIEASSRHMDSTKWLYV